MSCGLMCCSYVQVCDAVVRITKVFICCDKALSGQGDAYGEDSDRQSFGFDSESRIGKMKRHLDLRRMGKIVIHNRTSDLDLPTLVPNVT